MDIFATLLIDGRLVGFAMIQPDRYVSLSLPSP